MRRCVHIAIHPVHVDLQVQAHEEGRVAELFRPAHEHLPDPCTTQPKEAFGPPASTTCTTHLPDALPSLFPSPE